MGSGYSREMLANDGIDQLCETGEDLPKQVLCAFCITEPQNPVIAKCGHLFCRVCLDTWLQQHGHCSECRSTIKKDEIITVKEVNMKKYKELFKDSLVSEFIVRNTGIPNPLNILDLANREKELKIFALEEDLRRRERELRTSNMRCTKLQKALQDEQLTTADCIRKAHSLESENCRLKAELTKLRRRGNCWSPAIAISTEEKQNNNAELESPEATPPEESVYSRSPLSSIPERTQSAPLSHISATKSIPWSDTPSSPDLDNKFNYSQDISSAAVPSSDEEELECASRTSRRSVNSVGSRLSPRRCPQHHFITQKTEAPDDCTMCSKPLESRRMKCTACKIKIHYQCRNRV